MPPKDSKAKALEKKAENDAVKQRREDEEAERREAASWNVGTKQSKKAQEDEEKDAQRRQRIAEKAALEAAENAELSAVVRVGKPQKKKGKDDFDFLNAALAAQPKTKAQKEAEKRKEEEAARRRKEEEAAEAREAKRRVSCCCSLLSLLCSPVQAEEDYIKKMAAKGVVVNHMDDYFVPLDNHLDEDDFEQGTGLDAAIDVLAIAGKGDEHPERRQKALYNAYYEAMLPSMKTDLPGLKLSQYKERIFDLWARAPENPKNQVGKPSSTEV